MRVRGVYACAYNFGQKQHFLGLILRQGLLILAKIVTIFFDFLLTLRVPFEAMKTSQNWGNYLNKLGPKVDIKILLPKNVIVEFDIEVHFYFFA